MIYLDNKNITIANMPYEESDLICQLQNAKDKALHGLREMPQKDEVQEEEAKEKFEIFYQDDLKFTLSTNSTASETFNLALIDRIFRKTIKNLDQGLYKDNFELFESDWISGMKTYEAESRGPGKLVAITEFSKHGIYVLVPPTLDFIWKFFFKPRKAIKLPVDISLKTQIF